MMKLILSAVVATVILTACGKKDEAEVAAPETVTENAAAAVEVVGEQVEAVEAAVEK